MNQWFPNKSPTWVKSAMFSRVSFITFWITLFLLVSAPAHSAMTIYSWQDASGVIAFSDNPANAPGDAQVEVLSEDSGPQPVSETDSSETVAAQMPERPSRVVTQGEFAIQLVKELGLGEDPTAEEAADLLTSVRISPRLGRWELDRPMTPELTARLRKLTVAAAEMGWITLTPAQVLLAFDTTAALLGLTIPVTTSPEETPDSVYPIAEAPPLVSVEPPPLDIYPYYLWVPVTGGFWCNDFLFPGFFVLDVNLFFFNDPRFFSRNHLIVLDPSNIGRQFRSHIIDHHVKRSPVVSNPERVHRPRSGVRSASDPNRILNPPTRPHQDLRSSGSHFSGVQMGRRYASPRPMTIPPAIHRQSLPSRSIGSMPTVRSLPLRSLPERGINTATSVPRYSAPSMSHGFNTGLPQGGFGPATGRGSSKQ